MFCRSPLYGALCATFTCTLSDEGAAQYNDQGHSIDSGVTPEWFDAESSPADVVRLPMLSFLLSCGSQLHDGLRDRYYGVRARILKQAQIHSKMELLREQ